MKQLTLGSLFDGIGGFCYAAGIPSGIDTGCTIKPLWAAEVEPNCIDITRYRFKDVMHVGSVTELKGDEIQPVDIITFGSPCQDLSIAGIYLIGDFGGQRAGEILFKSESVLGYTPKSKEQRAEAAGQSTNSLRTESSRGGEVLGLDFAHADSVVRTYKDITPTLVQNMGRGGGQTPCIMYEQRTIAIDQGGGKSQCGITTELSPTLTCTHGGEPVIYSEKRNVIPLRDEVTRNKASNGLGVGKVGGPCPTLTTADIHSVFYEAYQHHGYRESDTSGTLTAGQNNTVRGDTPLIVTDKKAFEENQHGGYRETQINGTLRAAGGVLRRRVGNSDNREYQDKGEYP